MALYFDPATISLPLHRVSLKFTSLLLLCARTETRYNLPEREEINNIGDNLESYNHPPIGGGG